MGNKGPMQINLLEYKFEKKKIAIQLAKVISVYCLAALLIFISYYVIFSKAMEGRSQAEEANKQLHKEHKKLVSSVSELNNNQNEIRQKLIDQLNMEPISIVPQLSYLYKVAGSEINVNSITIDSNDVSITATADHCEKVKSYMEKINDSAYFGPLNEFRLENSIENNEIRIIIKVFRRP